MKWALVMCHFFKSAPYFFHLEKQMECSEQIFTFLSRFLLDDIWQLLRIVIGVMMLSLLGKPEGKF